MKKALIQDDINLVRIVLFGPESTGKTTLAIQLAKHYNTVWVEEYARPYLQNIWNQERRTCEPKDILPIAFGQIASENKLAKRADKVLICDTDLLETKVYSQEYYGGYVDPLLEKGAGESKYDLHFLTYIDTPWEADDLRDRPDQREQMFQAFKKALEDNNRPYILLKGDEENRLNIATKAIDKILFQKGNLYSFSETLKNE